MGCWGCDDAGDVECSRFGMFRMLDDVDVGCSGCRMMRMWDVRDVECLGCGMWEVDLQNSKIFQLYPYEQQIFDHI